MSREAMQQALEALEEYTNVVTSVNDPNSWVTVADGGKPAREAITALQAALAEPEQPVALSDERIDFIADTVVKGMPEGISGFCKSWGWRQFARAILQDCAGHYAPTPQPDTDCHAQGICQRSGYSIAPTPRKPLTDEEIIEHFEAEVDTGLLSSFADGVRFAERAHGIGEQHE